MSRLPGAVFAVVLSSLAAGACRSPEAASIAFLAQGDTYFAAKKYDEASIEYRNAIQRTPLSAEAYYKLGEVQAAKSDVVGALGSYIKAADLSPGMVDAQLKAANLLLLARKYEDAKNRLRAVLTKNPDNPDAVLMLGTAMAGLGSIDEAIAATRRSIALDPKRAGTYINLGAFQYRQGDKREAEASLKAGVETDSRSINARLGLADFYAAENRLVEAETTYHEALALDPASLRANRAIAGFFIRAGKLKEAEAPLRRVAESARSADDWYALCDYYIATRRKPQALGILENLRQQPATYVDATVKIAFLATLDHQPLEAMRMVNEVIAKVPNSGEALALKVHLLLGARKRLEALSVAQEAVRADPKSEAAHFAHAIAEAANLQREAAKNAFIEVLKLNPGSAEATMELTQLYLDQNLVDTAMQYAEQAIKLNSESVEARLMRVRVMARHSERRAEAPRELAALIARYPASPEVQYEAGLAAVGAQDPAKSYPYFQRALQLRPDYLRPLVELIKLDVQARRLPQARQRVDEALRKDPNSVEVLLIAGNTYGMIDPDVAEKHLRHVLELDPSNLTAYQSLAALYLSRNQLDKARGEFIHLASQQPTNVAPPTMVGIISEAQGNKPDAERWYQQALRINGRAATAANNLAWMYADGGTNLESAVELAQMARAELPRQAEVTDTLGWAFLKKGMAEQAIRVLQDAIEQDPKVALYQYHLGLAYAQAGEDGRARQALQLALKMDPKFPQAPDAQRALAKLLY